MTAKKKLTLRFRPGEDDDLIAWLDGLDVIYGKKGQAIKGALRRGIQSSERLAAPQLDTSDLLTEIRQVVEATLSTQLANLSFSSMQNTSGVDDDEASDLLDQLGVELVFDPEYDDEQEEEE